MTTFNSFVVIIACICIFLFYCNKYVKKKERFTFDKIPLWTYDNFTKGNTKLEIFKELCIESFNKYNQEHFEIIVIDELSLIKYIPNLPNNFNEFTKDLKNTFIKFNLLYEYGGLWVDINSIVFSDLKFFTDKLIQYDFIGFGSTEDNYENNNFYSKPLMNVMGSRKNSLLCNKFKNQINKFLKEENVSEIDNKFIINEFWESIEDLIKNNNYEYYHFSPILTGNFDNFNEPITDKKLFSNDNFDLDSLDMKLISVNFEKFNFDTDYLYNKDTIYNIKSNIITLFRKSLYPNHPYPDLQLIKNKNVDIYVLYIPKREVYIRNAIDRLFINPIYFKGYNKNELNEEELIKNDFISKEWTENPKFNFGRVACHMGHMEILKTFLTTTTKYALIFEDDIYIDLANVNYYRNKIKTILDNIPEDAQTVYLSFCWEYCDNTVKYNEIFSHSFRPLCRHMYLVSREGAKLILDNAKRLVKPGDNTIGELIQNKIIKSYNVNPDFFILEQNRQNLGSHLGNDKLYSICKKSKKKSKK